MDSRRSFTLDSGLGWGMVGVAASYADISEPMTFQRGVGCEQFWGPP